MNNAPAAPALSDTHAAVLARLVYASTVMTNRAYVEASTNPHDGVPFQTLAAMARRGLVELRWYQEDAIHVRARRYRVAVLTEAGRRAHDLHFNPPQSEPVVDRLGAPKVAHVVGCADVPADAVVTTSAQAIADDRLVKYHGCIGYPYSPPVRVVLVDTIDDGHAYEPSCIWPGGEDRPRCMQCRGTHAGDSAIRWQR